jgi:hypothetical protein
MNNCKQVIVNELYEFSRIIFRVNLCNSWTINKIHVIRGQKKNDG